jgi:prepilin-type N-terminal cleavage/methylation domain-containing protein
VKRKKRAFTLVELLIVVGVIAILIALLIPAIATVRNMAKETQQKAQLTTIEMALTAFKNDYGNYPPSNLTLDGVPSVGGDYCGAQKLTEALVGWDLMGFHPKSAWRADGEGENRRDETYDPDKNRDNNPADGTPDTLKERKGPYLELATANAFELGDLFDDTGPLEPNTFVLCDVFGKKSITVGGKTVKAGAPILYYRANTSSKTMDYTTIAFDKLIYDCMDNDALAVVKEQADGVAHPLADPANNREKFYKYITDPKVTVATWPSRPDSYLLISAGADGLYGTGDDICNFDPNLPG